MHQDKNQTRAENWSYVIISNSKPVREVCVEFSRFHFVRCMLFIHSTCLTLSTPLHNRETPPLSVSSLIKFCVGIAKWKHSKLLTYFVWINICRLRISINCVEIFQLPCSFISHLASDKDRKWKKNIDYAWTVTKNTKVKWQI